MIISENIEPTLEQFKQLMANTDLLLNADAADKSDYYRSRSGTKLEEDVFCALKKCALDTPFENTIRLISGSSFPDIVASGHYGVEVKSTLSNSFKSIGSSILESTRIKGVERIFLTFGKLSDPPEFISRPYEECLSEIVVTHYPRYQIDMTLKPGETIFDKMNIPYDTLRALKNPVEPISEYYKSRLGPGESLWWTSGSVETESSPPIVKLWSSLDADEKLRYMIWGYALFPEIVGSGSKKYQRFALWLATKCSVVNTNIRDLFSAGGKKDIDIADVHLKKVPASFDRIADNRSLFIDAVNSADEAELAEFWRSERILPDRIEQWCRLAADSCGENSDFAYSALMSILTA